MRKRRCVTCGRTKKYSHFKNTRARRCLKCATCHREGCDQLSLPQRDTCSNECERAIRLRNLKEGHRRHWAAWQMPAERTCTHCGVTKPLTVEYFGPCLRDEAGQVTKFHSWCRPCIRAIARDRYANSPTVQQRARLRAQRQRERNQQRVARDAEFAAEMRRREEQYRLNRRTRTQDGRMADQARVEGGRMPTLPVGPLMDLVKTIIEREQGDHISLRRDWPPVGHKGREAICEDLGIPARYLRAWVNNEYATVNYAVADRILMRTGLNWFDVWTEDEYPEVHERLAA